MMTIRHICILSMAAAAGALAVIASDPGYDDLKTALAKVVSVVEVRVIEAKTSSTVEGPNYLDLLAHVEETVAGEKVEGEIRARYEEFHAPNLSDRGIFLSWDNYTGSGDELRVRSKDRILLLLSVTAKGTNTCTIVRVESVAKKKDVQELFAAKDANPNQASEGSSTRCGSRTFNAVVGGQ